MKLYHHPLSGHAHRARLFLSLPGAARFGGYPGHFGVSGVAV